ncbi:MAG TPA: AraC family transcriptional regulator [Polyangiales bacterium]|nr:AraC family transcriptional regulator [Polyangiales bacterium]
MMQAHGSVRPLCFDGGAAAPPLLVSDECPEWAGVAFELHRARPFAHERDSGPPSGEQSLIILVDGATELTIREQDRETIHRSGPGSLSFHTPHERPRITRVTGTGKVLAMRLTPAWLDRVHPYGAELPSFQPPMAPDETLRALAAALCREVANGASSGALFAESLSLSLLSYAFERLPMARVRARGALAATQCRRLRTYIEERLHEELSVAELAALCQLRPRQFSHVFRRAFGRSPYQYVLERRVARAAELLKTASADLDEIALRAGFSSASHFSTVFRRAYGQAPGQFAREHRRTTGSRSHAAGS